MRYIALDWESSGTDPKRHAPVSLGVAVMENGEVVEGMEWIIKPQLNNNKQVMREYDVFALKVSGITLKQLEEGMPISAVMGELTTFVYEHADRNDTVVAFNSPFDLSFYSESLFLAGSWNKYLKKFETFKPPLVGPWQCVRQLCQDRISVDKYDLDTCAAYFGLSRESGRHGATEDAILAGKIYWELVK